jgi:hypothetical protein
MLNMGLYVKNFRYTFLLVSGPLGANFFTCSDSWFAVEDDSVGHFLPPVNVFNMGPPEASGVIFGLYFVLIKKPSVPRLDLAGQLLNSF